MTVTPTLVMAGGATLHLTVTRNATSGQSQQLGSVEIDVPSAFTIQTVIHQQCDLDERRFGPDGPGRR